jgi:endonuclease-3
VSSAQSDQQPTPTGETRLALVRRARRILRVLEQTYPDARCELEFADPFQLLCATVLSAQCTDVRVNSVTGELFRRFPDAESLAAAEPVEVESIIRPTGFFRAKAANLLGLAQSLVAEFDGVVPDRLNDLVTLPGVGRKTANVVLGNAFDTPGITVDTHVGRLSRRMGFTAHEDPVKVEQDLMAIFPRKTWTQMSHVMIWHGRRRCHSRRPACGACPVVQWCPGAGIGPLDPEQAAKLVKEPQ